MDYNKSDWRNKIFSSKKRITIDNIIDIIVSKYNDNYDEIVKAHFPELYDYASEICEILNESSHLKRKVRVGDITMYNVLDELNFYDTNHGLTYDVFDSDFEVVPAIWKKNDFFGFALKINIDKKWHNYKGDFAPSILSYMDKEKLLFINSLPKYTIHFRSIGYEDEVYNEGIDSYIPLEFVNDEISRLEEKKEVLEPLYKRLKDAYSEEKMAKINEMKEDSAKVLFSHMFSINEDKFFGLEVMDYKKPIDRENLKLTIYNSNLDVVYLIKGISDFITAKLKREKLVYKEFLEYKVDETLLDEYLSYINILLHEKYDEELKSLNKKQKVARQREELQEKLNRSIMIHEERERKKENAINQIAESIETISELEADEKIDIPSELLFEWSKEKNCYHIKEEFKGKLKYINLSCFSFENVDVSGIDFRRCNPTLLNPQKVYNKDLSGTRFDINDGEYNEKSGKVDYVPSSSWDLDGVTLYGSNLYVPLEYVRSNGLSMPVNIDKAKIDDKTILPDVLEDNLEKGNKDETGNYGNLAVENLLLNLIKNGESLNLVSKEEASMLKNYYIKEPEENKGGKTL